MKIGVIAGSFDIIHMGYPSQETNLTYRYSTWIGLMAGAQPNINNLFRTPLLYLKNKQQ